MSWEGSVIHRSDDKIDDMLVQENSFCRMCGGRCTDFAHSHIVPRAFTPIDDAGRKQIISAGGDGLFKKRMDGIYDDHILCHQCESRLARYDQYAVDIFRDKKNAVWKTCPDGLRIACWSNADRRTLRGFLASLLWRFSISRIADCQKVSIGKIYEKRIATDLMLDGSFEYVDALISVLHKHVLTHMISTPTKTRFGDAGNSVNGYHAILAGLEFYVSLDQRPHPLVDGPNVFDCGEEKIVGSMSLADRVNGYPYVIVDIGDDENCMRKILPIVASHKQNKKRWFDRLRCVQ